MNLQQAAQLIGKRGDFDATVAKSRKAFTRIEQKCDESVRKIQGKLKEAHAEHQRVLAKGREFSEAEGVLVGAFMADPGRRLIRQAPKRVRPQIKALERKIDTLALAVSEGRDYLKQISKAPGTIRSELADLRKHQEGKEADLAEARDELEQLGKRLEALVAAHDAAWAAWLEQVLKPVEEPASA